MNIEKPTNICILKLLNILPFVAALPPEEYFWGNSRLLVGAFELDCRFQVVDFVAWMTLIENLKLAYLVAVEDIAAEKLEDFVFAAFVDSSVVADLERDTFEKKFDYWASANYFLVDLNK